MNPRQPRPAFMPRGLRFAAGLCLVLSCASGLWAAMEASQLASLPELKQDFRENSATRAKQPDAELNERFITAQFAVLEPVHESRSVLLGALAVTCAVSFVAAGRLLRPAGISRESMRKMLGATALVAAVLRTIDGAQNAVMTRHMVGPLAEVMRASVEKQGEEAVAFFQAHLLPALPTVALVWNVVQTALIAGCFALLSQYFRSQRVRDTVVALDGPPPDFD